jgi:hypothetical protein
MTHSIAPASLVQLPADVHIYLVRFLPVRTIVALSSTCYHLFQLYFPVAQDELNQLGFTVPNAAARRSIRDIVIVDRGQRLVRNVYHLAFHLWRLSIEACRAVRNSLGSQPLRYFAEFEPAQVLLEEEALAARADDNSLARLANKEQDAKRAFVLASQITCSFLRDNTFFSLSERNDLFHEAILEMIQVDMRLSSRYIWGRTTLISRDTALKLIDKISDQKVRDLCYQALALQDPNSQEKALKLVVRIQDLDVLVQTLAKISKKSYWFACFILDILKPRISDPKKMDEVLHYLAMQVTSRPNALELINHISDQKLKALCFQARNLFDKVPETTQDQDDPAEGTPIVGQLENESQGDAPIQEPPLKRRRIEE